MSDIKKLDTSKYVTDGKVEVDGKIWEVVLPGAGTELKMTKMRRRTDFLSKKVENGTATEEDLDRLDAMEDEFFNFFKGIFKDSTDDNSEVNEWIEKTPMALIMQAIEDIREQANEDES